MRERRWTGGGEDRTPFFESKEDKKLRREEELRSLVSDFTAMQPEQFVIKDLEWPYGYGRGPNFRPNEVIRAMNIAGYVAVNVGSTMDKNLENHVAVLFARRPFRS